MRAAITVAALLALAPAAHAATLETIDAPSAFVDASKPGCAACA